MIPNNKCCKVVKWKEEEGHKSISFEEMAVFFMLDLNDKTESRMKSQRWKRSWKQNHSTQREE